MIGDYAFFNTNASIIGFENGTQIETIGYYSFSLTKISYISIPKTVKFISDQAFNNSKITSVYFESESKLESIGEKAFANTLITTFMIPNNLVTLGNEVFSNCLELVNVFIYKTEVISNIGHDVFANSNVKIYVPQNILQAYRDGWSQYSQIIYPNVKYTVKFLDYDGMILKQEQVLHATSATPPKDPTRWGYTFNGWDQNYDNVTSSLDIKAVFKPNQYRIFFDTDGGSLVDPIDAEFDSIVYLSATPTKEGYTFEGWRFGYEEYLFEMKFDFGYGIELQAIWKEAIFEYTIQDDQVTITDYIGTSTEVVIPERINRCLVTKIEEDAFREKGLTKVTISKHIEEILSYAFYGNLDLQVVEFEENSKLRKIGLGAFQMTSLTNFDIPELVTEIGANAFDGTKLETVFIPKNVIVIGAGAFGGKTIKSIVFAPNCQLSHIYYGTFYDTSITSVTIPASVVHIGAEVFARCEKLMGILVEPGNLHYTSVDGVLYNKDKKVLCQYPAGKLATEFVIPNHVTTINNYAFVGAMHLTKISYQENSILSVVGIEAFSYSSLVEVRLPQTVTIINHEVFKGVTTLQNVYLESITVPNFGNNVFTPHVNLKIFVPSASFDAYKTALPYVDQYIYPFI